MKSNLTKIFIVLAMLGMVALPLSAKSNKSKKQKAPQQQMQQGQPQNGNQQNGQPQYPNQPQHPNQPQRPNQPPRPMQNNSLMGTIKSFDSVNQIIEIEDADKSVRKIHISPNTIVMVAEKPEMPPPPAENGQPQPMPRGNNLRQRPTQVAPESYAETFKSGTWLSVDPFPTDTQTVEAHHIVITNTR